MSVVFLPAVCGLLPWHWRWMHAVPVEGVMGRVVSGFLVSYLNMPGRVDCGRRARRCRCLLCIGGQPLDALGESRRSLGAAAVVARPLAELARDARRAARGTRELADEQANPGPAQRIFSGAIGNELRTRSARAGRPAAWQRCSAGAARSLRSIPSMRFPRFSERRSSRPKRRFRWPSRHGAPASGSGVTKRLPQR